VPIVSYVVGAFATHALLVLVHECAHNLVFERRSLNRLAGILAGLPTVLVNAVTWGRYGGSQIITTVSAEWPSVS
jgi:sphingolipid delta-4 desaturase